jgi:hypothetical protein
MENYVPPVNNGNHLENFPRTGLMGLCRAEDIVDVRNVIAFTDSRNENSPA